MEANIKSCGSSRLKKHHVCLRDKIPMRKEYLVYGSPLIGEEEVEEVVATIRSGWLGTGPKTQRFEADFAAFQGIEYCVAVSSCSAALHLAMLAAGVKRGDEVIVPALTFCATANAVVHSGATPIFADINGEDLTIDPEDVRRRITPRTRAILPVHIHGYPAKMEPLRSLADEHGLLLIGDAAHAIEAEYKGIKIGHLADITCFSFYVTKNLTTVEGGMLATSNQEWADKIKILALHGMSKDAWIRHSDEGYQHYQVADAGFKYNMTDIQASFGIHQLARIEKNLEWREQLWSRYDEKLTDLRLRRPPTPSADVRHARHIYAVQVTEQSPLSRDRLLGELHNRNIGSAVHYTALHLHPYYRRSFGYREGDLPVAEAYGNTTLSLPLSPKVSDEDVDDVVEALADCLRS